MLAGFAALGVECDGSLDPPIETGGVSAENLLLKDGCLSAGGGLLPLKSLISIKSSSESMNSLFLLPFPFVVGVADTAFGSLDHVPSGSMVICSSDFGVLLRISRTYSSTARLLNGAGLLQIGHNHVGACS